MIIYYNQMEKEEILELISEEIQSYSDVNAPERMALAHFISRLERAFKTPKE